MRIFIPKVIPYVFLIIASLLLSTSCSNATTSTSESEVQMEADSPPIDAKITGKSVSGKYISGADEIILNDDKTVQATIKEVPYTGKYNEVGSGGIYIDVGQNQRSDGGGITIESFPVTFIYWKGDYFIDGVGTRWFKDGFQDVAKSPVQELEEIISRADNLPLSLQIPGEMSLMGNRWSDVFTQKNGNIRVERTDDSCEGGHGYAIYNASRKQIAVVDCGVGFGTSGAQLDKQFGTSGWKRSEEGGRDIDLENRKNIVLAALEDNVYGHRSLESLIIKKVADGYSIKYSEDDRDSYVIKCEGIFGLPSEVVKREPAFGANPSTESVVLEFHYSRICEVNDDTFELDSSLPVTDGIPANIYHLEPSWAHSLFSN